VSITAVGPVGTAGGLAWLVVLGASGSWSDDGEAGDCPSAETLKAKANAR
jgi:hypothetical protein